MKKAIALLATISASTLCANAAITYVHTYKLGEAGSIVGDKPQDGTGSAHFTTALRGGATTQTSGAGVPGSTAHTSFNIQGASGADFSGFATNNFGIEFWARTSSIGGIFFSTGSSTGHIIFGLDNSNWIAGIHGGEWIGAASGTGQPRAADTWTHLAIIRNNGVSTFYINGVAQTGTSTDAPTHSTGYIDQYYTGGLDELRMFTFDPATDDPVAALNLQAVPEPSTTALLGLGSLALILRRRK